MKIIQVVDALPSLQKLAEQDLSIKKLYKVSKLLDNIENEIAFYNEQRNKILAKYCDIVGNQYVPREADMDKINAELGELMNTEVECNIHEVVIGTDEDVKLSYKDLTMLRDFIRIEGED